MSEMKIRQNVTELIGRTPLLRLGRLAPDRHVLAKCEFMNPLSLKDRAVLQIVQDAEAAGQLLPGDDSRCVGLGERDHCRLGAGDSGR